MAVYAQDFSIAGGTLGRTEGDKIIALMDKALELRIPVVAMLDSGGAPASKRAFWHFPSMGAFSVRRLRPPV